MQPILSAIHEHLAIIVGIVCSLSVLIPKVRSGIGLVWRWVAGKLGMGKLDAILNKVTFIEAEMRFNGGNSLRDMVVMQHNRQRQQFWRSARPSIEIDGDAMVRLVSESACHLFGVSDPAELYLRNWLRFIEPGKVDEILRAYVETVRSGSRFIFEVNLKDLDSKPLGRWEIRLNPLTSEGMSRQLYTGYFAPSMECEIARAKSKEISL